MRSGEKAKKKALKTLARAKINRVYRALTTGDLDGRHARVKKALETEPRVSRKRKAEPPADAADEEGENDER